MIMLVHFWCQKDHVGLRICICSNSEASATHCKYTVKSMSVEYLPLWKYYIRKHYIAASILKGAFSQHVSVHNMRVATCHGGTGSNTWMHIYARIRLLRNPCGLIHVLWPHPLPALNSPVRHLLPLHLCQTALFCWLWLILIASFLSALQSKNTHKYTHILQAHTLGLSQLFIQNPPIPIPFKHKRMYPQTQETHVHTLHMLVGMRIRTRTLYTITFIHTIWMGSICQNKQGHGAEMSHTNHSQSLFEAVRVRSYTTSLWRPSSPWREPACLSPQAPSVPPTNVRRYNTQVTL